MNSQTFVQFVKKTTLLREDQKERIFKLLPRLHPKDLAVLEAVLLQGEATLDQMKKNDEIVLGRLMQLFTAMNKRAIQLAKKDAFQFMEREEKGSDQNLDEILNRLKDVS